MTNDTEEVLNFKPRKIKANSNFRYKESRSERILLVLENSEVPLNISAISRLSEIHNWYLTKDILLKLAETGQIEHFRSGICLMSRIKKAPPPNFTIENDGKGVVTFKHNNQEALMSTKNIIVMLEHYGVENASRKLKKALVSQKNFPKTIPLATINQAVTQILRSTKGVE